MPFGQRPFYPDNPVNPVWYLFIIGIHSLNLTSLYLWNCILSVAQFARGRTYQPGPTGSTEPVKKYSSRSRLYRNNEKLGLSSIHRVIMPDLIPVKSGIFDHIRQNTTHGQSWIPGQARNDITERFANRHLWYSLLCWNDELKYIKGSILFAHLYDFISRQYIQKSSNALSSPTRYVGCNSYLARSYIFVICTQPGPRENGRFPW